MLSFKNSKNTVTQGNMGLGLAIGYFSLLGYTVCLPLNDNQNYDLIVDIENKLCKVQVKTTAFKQNNKYVVQLKAVRSNRTSNNILNFDGTKIDYLFIVTEDDENTPKSAITLTEKYKQYRIN